MSTLSSEEINHLANLAHLSLDDEERLSFSEQLPRIVDFVDQLSSASRNVVNNEEGLVSVESLRNDVINSERLSLEELEKLAPVFLDGKIVVPPVLGEGSDA